MWNTIGYKCCSKNLTPLLVNLTPSPVNLTATLVTGPSLATANLTSDHINSTHAPQSTTMLAVYNLPLLVDKCYVSCEGKFEASPNNIFVFSEQLVVSCELFETSTFDGNTSLNQCRFLLPFVLTNCDCVDCL